MADPKLADVLNPRLPLQRRMDAEEQAEPFLPDRAASSSIRFQRPYTQEERRRQQELLIRALRKRDPLPK